MTDHCDHSSRIDRGDAFIGRREPRPPGDVAAAAITVGRGDRELLRPTRRQLGFARRQRNQNEFLLLGVGAGAARCDPGGEHPVVVAVDLQPLASLVGHCHRGLRQEQARARICQIHPPPSGVPRDGEVIGGGIVAKQRKPETALPGERPVAAATVAASLGKDRHHVDVEADIAGLRRRHMDDDHRRDDQRDQRLAAAHANSSLIGSVPKSVSAKGRPAGPCKWLV